MTDDDLAGFAWFTGFVSAFVQIRIYEATTERDEKTATERDETVRWHCGGRRNKPCKPFKPCKIRNEWIMNSRHLISTTATLTDCKQCGHPTLTALDEGLPAQVDTTPINPAANEWQILATGKRTYTLTPSKQLIHRTAGRIRGGWLTGTIHAEHKCENQPQPEQLTLDLETT